MWLFQYDYEVAAGTSLAVLAVPVTLPAAWTAYRQGQVDLLAAVCIAVAFVTGALLGRVVVPYFADRVWVLRLGFGLMLIFIATRFILSSDDAATSAGVGLASVALGWLVYLGLRAIGRRALPPDLGKKIRQAAERTTGESEYYI
jgi:hypothetical protein